METQAVKRIVIYQNGAEVGRCRVGACVIEGFKAPTGQQLTILSLPRLQLQRQFVFRHLQRVPLTTILNGCGAAVHFDDSGYHPLPQSDKLERDEAGVTTIYSTVEPVWTVHAVSEVYRGKAAIRSVVLAHLAEEGRWSEYLVHLPEIYRRVTLSL